MNQITSVCISEANIRKWEDLVSRFQSFSKSKQIMLWIRFDGWCHKFLKIYCGIRKVATVCSSFYLGSFSLNYENSKVYSSILIGLIGKSYAICQFLELHRGRPSRQLKVHQEVAVLQFFQILRFWCIGFNVMCQKNYLHSPIPLIPFNDHKCESLYIRTCICMRYPVTWCGIIQFSRFWDMTSFSESPPFKKNCFTALV